MGGGLLCDHAESVGEHCCQPSRGKVFFIEDWKCRDPEQDLEAQWGAGVLGGCWFSGGCRSSRDAYGSEGFGKDGSRHVARICERGAVPTNSQGTSCKSCRGDQERSSQ